ncbi:MAG: choice-of-anchor J domain-containing protein, partial [Bacteroidetes bacterium]|nr:choice-of-anchor J domain-containing protein [Bacteroidota bacterium]
MKKVFFTLLAVALTTSLFTQTYYRDLRNQNREPKAMVQSKKPTQVSNSRTITVFQEDFEAGIPSTFTLRNLDGLTPDANVNYVTDAWVIDPSTPSDLAIQSTSWYNPVGAADDWVILPAISIPANARLRWNACAVDSDFPDGYQVRISTTDTAIASFTTVAFSIAAENPAWTNRTISLSAFAGQDIYIAFRNNSFDMYLLLVDDIEVYISDLNDIAVSRLITPVSSTSLSNQETVTVQVKNEGINPQTNIPITYQINGGNPVTETINATIDPLTTYNYSFLQPTDLSAFGINSIIVYASLNGDEVQSNDTIFKTIIKPQNQDPPVIEGVYLPVCGSRFKWVCDYTCSNFPIPSVGANQVWDFSDAFIPTDTVDFVTDYPATFPHYEYFPGATNAASHSGGQTGLNGYYFFKVDTTGIYRIGAWINSYDTSVVVIDPELVAPTEMSSMMNTFDSSEYIIYSLKSGFNIKSKFSEIIQFLSLGHGTMITPVGIFQNVLQVKYTKWRFDSTWVDITGTGNYSYLYDTDSIIYTCLKFFRNNTFATNQLIEIDCGDPSCTYFTFGLYVLPADIGAITGTVRDSLGAPVTNGKMLLYREHSNFRKNDILSTVPIHNDGTYRFDSIPYGVYRIAARPDTVIYPTALTTFYGDVDNWMTCDTVVTDGDTSGIDITLRYHPSQAGLTTLSGNVMYNLIYNSNSGLKAIGSGRPVKDVDVTVKKKTSKAEEIVAQIQTDTSGNYQISGLENGMYEILVGMPGLHMFSTHELEINNT